ncbi:OB-fold protein [Neisseria wadsworthii]|uniref:Lipoprotein n=1 Tax=Neisseria wadsworthii 9715 TaxID=1030841 RepID=G4CPJ3_9NEIS|nr:hypothetical protein [Neisseria wadsworthii]EGZ47756.1 hypothetical protein HMPREF9370_1003 [Neisseria wadsworthii 9715]
MNKLLFPLVCTSSLIFLSACGDTPETTQTASPPTEAAAPAEPPIKTTANELLKAYKENEVGANKKFKGKTLHIAATIASIDADFSDNPFLTLKAGGDMDMFNRPQAHLAKTEHDKAANLKKGQKINLTCIGNSEVAGTPMLADCTIQ